MTILLLILSFIIIQPPEDGPMVPRTTISRPAHTSDGTRGKVPIERTVGR